MNEVTPPRSKFTFIFDGNEISAQPGQSVAAAILNQGSRILRQSRATGKPRSVFCGIGICFDCLVVIDGVPNQRACLAQAKAGLIVEIQLGTGADNLPVGPS